MKLFPPSLFQAFSKLEGREGGTSKEIDAQKYRKSTERERGV